MSDELSSTLPYLLRAMHEWMTDNDQTPLVIVDTTVDGVDVPTAHIKDNRIVLNLAWAATRNLQMQNELVSFEARFGGVAHAVSFPPAAIQGIFARESGQGMQFRSEPLTDDALADQTAFPQAQADTSSDEDSDPPPPTGGKAPFLKVVK